MPFVCPIRLECCALGGHEIAQVRAVVGIGGEVAVSAGGVQALDGRIVDALGRVGLAYGAELRRAQPPLRGARVDEHVPRVRRCVLDVLFLERQPVAHGPTCHPAERLIGEAGIRIATTDVGVRPDKPCLLEDLLPNAIALQALLKPRLALPDGRGEEPPAFVKRQCLEGARHVVTEVGVMEAVPALAEQAQWSRRNAHGADRVPDADKIDPGFPWLGLRREARQKRAPLCLGPLLRRGAVIRPGVGKFVHVLLGEEPDQPDQAAETAHRVRAAREAEEKQLVARLIIVDEEAIRLLDVLGQAHAEEAADEPVQQIAGADPGVIEHDLGHPEVVGGTNGADHLDHVRWVVLLVGPVPRSIAADDQSLLRHMYLPALVAFCLPTSPTHATHLGRDRDAAGHGVRTSDGQGNCLRLDR
jgi:hypothetical protein